MGLLFNRLVVLSSNFANSKEETILKNKHTKMYTLYKMVYINIFTGMKHGFLYINIVYHIDQTRRKTPLVY